MRRAALVLGIVALLAVGGWYSVRHSPACNDWQERVMQRFRRVEAIGPGHELAIAHIEGKLEPSRPFGCPRLT